MTSQRWALFFAVCVALHPLALLGWAFDWTLPAYVLEGGVAGLFAFGMRPWLLFPTDPAPPERILDTVDGYKTQVSTSWLVLPTLLAATLATALSTVTATGGVGLTYTQDVTALIAFALLHGLVHGVVFACVALACSALASYRSTRRIQRVRHVFRSGEQSVVLTSDLPIHLDVHGPRLVIGEGRSRMVVRADPAELAWLVADLEAHRQAPEGPIPENVRQVMAAAAGAHEGKH